MSSAASGRKRDTVVEALSEEIASGAYRHDTRLPTIAALCERFGVSDLTARNALTYLAEMGLIVSIPGHGWHVREDQRRRFPLLTIDKRGNTTRDVWRTWLANEGLVGGHDLTVLIGTPPPHVTKHLNLADGAECVARRRIRYIDGEPVMISTGYFPMYLNDGSPLAAGTELAITGHGDAVDLNKPSPLDIVAERGHQIVADEDQISSRSPEPAEAAVLRMSHRGMPVLVNCRTSYDAAGIAVRCTHDVMASHRFMLVVYHEQPCRDVPTVRETAS